MSQEPLDTYQHPLMSAVQDATERAQQIPGDTQVGPGVVPVIPKGFPDHDVLHTTMDARVWAQQFKATAERLAAQGSDILDDGWLISWFANAIMRGYDTGRLHEQARRWLGTDEQQTPLTLEQLKSAALMAALERTHGNVAKTARELGVDRRTVYRARARLQGKPTP